MTKDRIPGLDELAFQGRNQSYGAYQLRKRYPRYLLVGVITGCSLILLAVLGAWSYYFMTPSSPLVEGLPMVEVEYFAMSAPPENDPSELAQAFARPVPETEKMPVVSDSVVPEKQALPEEPPREKEEEPAHTDTAATPGGSGMGTGAGDDTGIAAAVDVYPRYPGGDEARLNYLRRQVRYPETALNSRIQGVVMVVFVVELDGSLTHVDVPNRIGGGCDEEAIRVTRQMPRWEPGKRDGKAVRVMVRMPIVFKIPGKFVTFGK